MLDVTKISRYDVIERIAENAFSVVYRGRDSVHHRPVAIKVCIASDVALRNRFLRLAEAAAPLRHPNIVEVLEFGSGDGRPYLIEEFLPGGDLRDWIDRGDPIAGERELEILDEIARALEYAHRKGVLHQDLKPATVHLEDGHRVKLVDFGLARLNTAAAKLREPGETLKADGYLPPEQALGLPADARTDLYCFGALAYELITKLPPFPRGKAERIPTGAVPSKPEPLTSFWSECPPALAALIDRCLALSPGDRYATFEELREELTPLVEGMRGRRRAHQVRPASSRADRTHSPQSSLDDTMAIPPDVLAPRAQTPPEELTWHSEDGLALASPLEDTRETTLPLPPEVVAAAARANTLPPAASLTLTPASTGVQEPPAKMATKPAPIPAAAHAPLAAPASGLSPRALPPRALPRRQATRRLWLGLAGGAVGAILLTVYLTLQSSSAPATAQKTTPALAPAPSLTPTASAPTSAATGLLVIDATPWGQISRITGDRGRELPLPTNRYTPLAIAVPAGAYTVEVSRAGFAGSRTCIATVSSAGQARCLADLEAVVATEYFKEAGWWR